MKAYRDRERDGYRRALELVEAKLSGDGANQEPRAVARYVRSVLAVHSGSHGDEAPDMDSDGAIRDCGAIRSSFSGRTWGVSVDRINGQEVVSVTELETPLREANEA